MPKADAKSLSPLRTSGNCMGSGVVEWCGGVAVWRWGGVAVGRCGGVAVWRCGGVAAGLWGSLISYAYLPTYLISHEIGDRARGFVQQLVHSVDSGAAAHDALLLGEGDVLLQ